MRKNKKSMTVNELKAGMIVANNVEQDGKVLLGQNITITQSMIDKLKSIYFFEEVEVYYEEEVSQETKNRIDSKKIENEFNELSLNLSTLFDNMIYEEGKINGTCVQEVREFRKRIKEELKSTSIVIKNIILYGSGEDCIYRHGINVAALSSILGSWIGIDENQINLLVYSALLHDFGKTRIDENVLNKNTPLTKDEFNIIKSHASVGYDYIKNIEFWDKSVSYGVLMHHERIDGSGYPLGIKGEKIHPFAKIIAIADVFDAINSDRVYKKKKLPFEAMQIVNTESLGKLDYEYSKVFLEHVSNYYMGEEVLLNTDEVCKIIQMDLNNLDRPLVLKNGDFIDLAKEKNLYIKEIIL